MNIRQLETFVTVADYKSFTKASEILYVTQPTVSNHISSLEEELDTVLFIRTRKNITMTKSGKLLYSHALNMLSAYNTMTDDLKSFSSSVTGHLNINASSVPRRYLLPKILVKFSAEYPSVSYSLSDNDSLSVIESLEIGETDFGFVGMERPSKKLHYTEFMNDELVLVSPKGRLEYMNRDGYVEIKDFLDLELILREEGSGTRGILEDTLAENGYSINDEKIKAIVEDPATILNMVISGLGSTVISIYELENIKDKVDIAKIKNLSLDRPFYFAFNKDMQYVPLNRTFKAFILETYGVKTSKIKWAQIIRAEFPLYYYAYFFFEDSLSIICAGKKTVSSIFSSSCKTFTNLLIATAPIS